MEQTLDPVAIANQRYESERQFKAAEFDRQWQDTWKMQSVYGLERTQKMAADLLEQSRQDAAAMQQKHQTLLSTFDTIAKAVPEHAPKIQARALLGPDVAEAAFPTPENDKDKFFTLFNKLQRMDSEMSRFLPVQAEPQKRSNAARITRIMATAGTGWLSPRQPSTPALQTYDPNIAWTDKKSKQIKYGQFRPATPEEQQIYAGLKDARDTLYQEFLDVVDGQNAERSRLREIARTSPRMEGGTFGEKVAFSSPNLKPDTAPIRILEMAAGDRVAVIDPEGRRGTIPAAQLEAALQNGFKRAQ